MTSLTKSWLLANILQRDIMNLRQWKSNGSFDDFKIPKSLTTLLEWVLAGYDG